MKNYLQCLLHYWLLCLIEKILGEDVEPEQQILLGECYRKLADRQPQPKEKDG